MSIAFVVATRKWERWHECVLSWFEKFNPDVRLKLIDNTDDYNYVNGLPMNIMQSYQYGLDHTWSPIVAFIHDDVMCFDPNWDVRVEKEFEDPTVGMVGFGGATQQGASNIYQVPYELSQLGRLGFASNMIDAEVHGARFTGERDVACLDGFAMFVRREILERCGGWPQGTPIGYFMYDFWLSCEVRRQGYRTRLVGVSCQHFSGKTASMVQLKESHADAHRYIYDTCRDVLPWEARND